MTVLNDDDGLQVTLPFIDHNCCFTRANYSILIRRLAHDEPSGLRHGSYARMTGDDLTSLFLIECLYSYLLRSVTLGYLILMPFLECFPPFDQFAFHQNHLTAAVTATVY